MSTPDNLAIDATHPAGVEALATLLLKSKKPTIIAGDDVARSGGERALVAGQSDNRVVRRAAHHAVDQPSSYRQSLPGDARQCARRSDTIVLSSAAVL